MISVVTVSFNAKDYLKKTINSILSQYNADFEYIIKDGESIDNTLDIAKGYKELFIKRNIPFHIISEKDRGIYDAMNKAADLAKGDYIIYINAGDELASNTTLYYANEYIISHKGDIFYGDTILVRGRFEKTFFASDEKDLRKKIEFCHQSAFIRTSLMKEYKYDLSYKICADRDFFTKCLVNGKKFCNIHMAVSKYLLGGYSSANASLDMYLEELDILYRHSIIDRNTYCNKRNRIIKNHRIEVFKQRFSDRLSKYIPMIQIIRGWKYIEKSNPKENSI